MPTILRTIVHDAIVYFLVIFTPHFVLEMTLLLAEVSISTLGDGRGAEISPAESSALASYISAGFNAYLRTTLIKSPCVIFMLSGNNVCVLIAWWAPQTHSNPTYRYLPIMVSRLMLSQRKLLTPQIPGGCSRVFRTQVATHQNARIACSSLQRPTRTPCNPSRKQSL